MDAENVRDGEMQQAHLASPEGAFQVGSSMIITALKMRMGRKQCVAATFPNCAWGTLTAPMQVLVPSVIASDPRRHMRQTIASGPRGDHVQCGVITHAMRGHSRCAGVSTWLFTVTKSRSAGPRLSYFVGRDTFAFSIILEGCLWLCFLWPKS